MRASREKVQLIVFIIGRKENNEWEDARHSEQGRPSSERGRDDYQPQHDRLEGSSL